MFEYIRPELDRNDKFKLLNSSYKLSYITFNFTVYTGVALYFGYLAATLIRIEFGPETIISQILISVLLLCNGIIFTDVINRHLFQKIIQLADGDCHIKHANIQKNIILGFFPILLLYIFTFGLDSNGLIHFSLKPESLLYPEAEYSGVLEWLTRAGATVSMSSLVVMGFSATVRVFVVIYYNYIHH